MRYFLLFSSALLIAFASYANTPERDYDGVFDGKELSERNVARVKKLDRWIFESPEDLFVGLPSIFTENKRPKYYQKTFYAGIFNRQMRYISKNESGLKNVIFRHFLFPGKEATSSHILVAGIPDLEYMRRPEFEDTYGAFLFDDLAESDHVDEILTSSGNCLISRLSQNNEILKTRILILRSGSVVDKRVREQSDIACINRGHYFHFGFSGVASFEDNTFSRFSENRQSFIMNLSEVARIPLSMLAGELNGLPRKEFLKIIANRVATRPR